MVKRDSFKIGRISVTRGSRRGLVKVVLLRLCGRGNLQDDATPSFFPDSKNPLIGLSNDVSHRLGFWLKGSLILENKNQKCTCSKLSTSPLQRCQLLN